MFEPLGDIYIQTTTNSNKVNGSLYYSTWEHGGLTWQFVVTMDVGTMIKHLKATLIHGATSLSMFSVEPTGFSCQVLSIWATFPCDFITIFHCLCSFLFLTPGNWVEDKDSSSLFQKPGPHLCIQSTPTACLEEGLFSFNFWSIPWYFFSEMDDVGKPHLPYMITKVSGSEQL